jgi:hypothetical protein
MTQAETAKLVAVLLAAFPQSRATSQTSQVYERMLADMDYPAANAAVERLLASSRFMPSVAEIRETALAITVGEQKPGGEAWGTVLKAISAEGVYRKPGEDFRFGDAVTAKCVAAMGWENLCNSENQQADRARFTELYDKLAVHERRKQLSESLPAMQRFRALQAVQNEQKRIERTSATSVGAAMGQVLSLIPMPKDDEP